MHCSRNILPQARSEGHRVIVMAILASKRCKSRRKMFRTHSAPSPPDLQHINDLLTGATDDLLHHALVDFVNMLLSGACNNDINAVIFGGRVIALSKKTVEFALFQWATHEDV